MYGARAYHASDQAETHYARAADALEVRGIRVEQRAALAGALDAGLRGEGVTVIDVVVTRDRPHHVITRVGFPHRCGQSKKSSSTFLIWRVS